MGAALAVRAPEEILLPAWQDASALHSGRLLRLCQIRDINMVSSLGYPHASTRARAYPGHGDRIGL